MSDSTLGKSATRMWRDQVKSSQTTLPFAAWITREKQKMAADSSNSNLLLVDRTLNDSVHAAIKDATESGGLQTKPAGNTVFGINKTLFVIGAILLVAGGTWLAIQTFKTKK